MSEIILILVVALVFLGPRKLPELASGLGKMIRELRKATADIKQEIELDETIRKPLEELREATMLPPEELKRRDLERALREREEKEEREREEKEERERKASEERERAENEKAAAAASSVSVGTPAGSAARPAADKTIAMKSPPAGMVSPSEPAPWLAPAPKPARAGVLHNDTVLGVGQPGGVVPGVGQPGGVVPGVGQPGGVVPKAQATPPPPVPPPPLSPLKRQGPPPGRPLPPPPAKKAGT